MSWWAANRRLSRIALATLATVVVTALWADVNLPIPNLAMGGHLGVPITLFLPLALVAVVFAGLAGRPVDELTATRPTHWLDLALIVGTSALCVVAAAVIHLADGSHLATACARNYAGYCGLGLVGRYLLGGHASTVLPAAYAVTAALFGRSLGHEASIWAWPIAQPTDPVALSLALATFAAGIATMMLAARTRIVTRRAFNNH